MEGKTTKEFAREAKLRLLSPRNNRMGMGYPKHSYVLNSRVLTEREVGDIYQRMILWMEVSPCDILSRLADQEEFAALNTVQKEKYMLQLSAIYRSLRTEYENQRKTGC